MVVRVLWGLAEGVLIVEAVEEVAGDVTADAVGAVEEEAEEGAGPRVDFGKRLVMLGSELAQPGDAGPRDAGEIVVFDVIPDVQCEPIPRAVVGAGRLPRCEREVLGVTAHPDGMKAEGQQRGDGQVGEHRWAVEPDQGPQGDATDDVRPEPSPVRERSAIPARLSMKDERSEREPEGSPPPRITGEVLLLGRRRLRVLAARIAEPPVVAEVLVAEVDGRREAERKVGEDGERLVHPPSLEDEIVRELVDGHADRVRDDGAEDPTDQRRLPPGDRSDGEADPEL